MALLLGGKQIGTLEDGQFLGEKALVADDERLVPESTHKKCQLNLI